MNESTIDSEPLRTRIATCPCNSSYMVPLTVCIHIGTMGWSRNLALGSTDNGGALASWRPPVDVGASTRSEQTGVEKEVALLFPSSERNEAKFFEQAKEIGRHGDNQTSVCNLVLVHRRRHGRQPGRSGEDPPRRSHHVARGPVLGPTSPRSYGSMEPSVRVGSRRSLRLLEDVRASAIEGMSLTTLDAHERSGRA